VKQKQQAVRAGFVAIVGRPNVGKSTLLNHILGEKIAIVSPRPQTTRTRILGVWNAEPRSLAGAPGGAQLAFFDTPGLHRAKGALNARMVEVALTTLGEVDVVLMLIEAGTAPDGSVVVGEATRWAIEQVRKSGKPAVLGVNKMDRAPRESLLPLIAAYKDLHAWTEIVPFSARTGENVDDLLATLARLVPESAEPMFPSDVLTDQAERAIAAEYVREQIMLRLREEVPYAAAVEVEEFDESEREQGPRGLVRISAVIHVERESQKGIVIGKKGAMLKEIGQGAREALERLLGCKVFLALAVRVDERWSERAAELKRFGL
jgi:GTP-binding protein Era